jgi:hypothetical protein
MAGALIDAEPVLLLECHALVGGHPVVVSRIRQLAPVSVKALIVHSLTLHAEDARNKHRTSAGRPTDHESMVMPSSQMVRFGHGVLAVQFG